MRTRPPAPPACIQMRPRALRLRCQMRQPAHPPAACERAPARAARAPAPARSPLHLVLTFDTARRRLRRRRLVSALDQPQHLWCAIPRAPASHCKCAPDHPPRLPAFKCARALLGSAAKCASPPTRPHARARARESLQKRTRPPARLPVFNCACSPIRRPACLQTCLGPRARGFAESGEPLLDGEEGSRERTAAEEGSRAES